MVMKSLVVLTWLPLAQSLLFAGSVLDFKLANTLGSNMVLEHAPSSACLFGQAKGGVQIQIFLDGNLNTQGSANSAGDWRVCLTPQASGGPHEVGILLVACVTGANLSELVLLASQKERSIFPILLKGGLGEKYATFSSQEKLGMNFFLWKGLSAFYENTPSIEPGMLVNRSLTTHPFCHFFIYRSR